MALVDIFKGRANITMHISDSGSCKLWVYDTLKNKCNADLTSVYTVTNKSELNDVIDVIGSIPLAADKWFVVIDWAKAGKFIKGDILNIFRVDTAEFLIELPDYKSWLKCKEALKTRNVLVNELYMSVMRKADCHTLLGAKLPSALVGQISNSYYRDVEKVFEVVKLLEDGESVKSLKDVQELVGISSGTLNEFLVLLLRSSNLGKKGVTLNKKRDLLNSVGTLTKNFGHRKLQNYLIGRLRIMIEVKTLYAMGVIYDTAPKKDSIPSGFNADGISRLSMYEVKQALDFDYVIMYKLLGMLQGGYWAVDLDIQSFLYNWFSVLEEDM